MRYAPSCDRDQRVAGESGPTTVGVCLRGTLLPVESRRLDHQGERVSGVEPQAPSPEGRAALDKPTTVNSTKP